MECEGYRTKLFEYLDGELAGVARAEFEAHLKGCRGCREELQELHETLALIERMPAPEPPEAFWQQYLRELRQKVAPVPTPSRWETWLGSIPLRPIPALAVGIVLILAVFLTWQSGVEQPPMPDLASLKLAQHLAMSQDLDLLREIDLLEEIELLEDWELIRSRDVQGPPRTT